jgi:hypothetical protein
VEGRERLDDVDDKRPLGQQPKRHCQSAGERFDKATVLVWQPERT